MPSVKANTGHTPLLLNQGYFVGFVVGEATELASKLL
jgi:hypothetical protein